jgi:hypothetical protein
MSVTLSEASVFLFSESRVVPQIMSRPLPCMYILSSASFTNRPIIHSTYYLLLTASLNKHQYGCNACLRWSSNNTLSICSRTVLLIKVAHGTKYKPRSHLKVKLFLCLIYYVPRYEDVWSRGDIATAFLTLVLHADKLSASRPWPFIPGKTAPGTRCGWAPEPVWTLWRREMPLPSAGNPTPTLPASNS